MVYNLTADDIVFLDDFVTRIEAFKVQVDAHNEAHRNGHKSFTNGHSKYYRRLGLGAELAFARLFDLPFNDYIGITGDGGVDFTLPNSLTIQIKCRGKRNQNFAVMPDLVDFKADIGVLMWPVTPEIRPVTAFEVAGWVSRVSFFQLAIRGNFRGERLYVPHVKMHDPALLKQIANANP